MSNTPFREEIPTGPSSPRAGGTAAATRLLLRSVQADLKSLATGVKRRISASPIRRLPAGRIGRFCKPVAKCIAGVAVVGALLVTVTMLWVLRDLPLDIDSAEAREREILLEASNGKPLGRVGPLRISNASRETFPSML